MLDRLAGNELLRRDLAAALRAGRLAHGLLLCGEAGLGAGFAARCLAADYLFPEGGPAAEAVLAGESSECIGLRGAGAQGIIKVEQVRAVRSRIYGTALSAAGRVVILYGAQNLNASSGNALLKVLEEPPPGVLFVLTASGPAAVLGTVRSRCAVYTLSPVGEEGCAAWLGAHCPGVGPAGARQLAAIYAGQIGRALRAANQPERAAVLRDALAIARQAAAGQEYPLLAAFSAYEAARKPKKSESAPKGAGGFAQPGEAGEEPADPVQPLLADLACIGSAVLRGQPELVPGLGPRQAARMIRAAQDAGRAIAANLNRKLVLTNLALALARP